MMTQIGRNYFNKGKIYLIY